MTVVHWPLATRVARRFAGTYPLEGTYHEKLFADAAPGLVETAAEQVAEATGLEWVGSPRVAVVGRRDWAEANLASFSRLLAGAEEALASTRSGIGRSVAGRVVAAEVGALVGVLAKRVLGQYELVLPTEDGRDTIMLVGSNIMAMERRHQFRPSEFRMWVALHECTHRLQFTAVPWMKEYFLGLVDELVAASAPEPGRLGRLAEEMRTASREGRPLVGDAGLIGLLATEEQREALDKVQALMSLLEGHGHVVMDRVGARTLVTQNRMSRLLKARRSDPRTAAFFKLTGLEMKMRQYEEGERFIEAIERLAGFAAVDAAWSGPDALPTLSEIRDPATWLSRVA